LTAAHFMPGTRTSIAYVVSPVTCVVQNFSSNYNKSEYPLLPEWIIAIHGGLRHTGHVILYCAIHPTPVHIGDQLGIAILIADKARSSPGFPRSAIYLNAAANGGSNDALIYAYDRGQLVKQGHILTVLTRHTPEVRVKEVRPTSDIAPYCFRKYPPASYGSTEIRGHYSYRNARVENGLRGQWVKPDVKICGLSLCRWAEIATHYR
jgi:hypothetical protein